MEEEADQENDFERKMELMDALLEFKRQHNLIKPMESPFECEGCSS